MTEGSAVAAETGATAVAAAAATEVVAAAAAGDTPVATEIIGRGQKLNLNHVCCALFVVTILKLNESLSSFSRSQGGYSNERGYRDYENYGKHHFHAFDLCM